MATHDAPFVELIFFDAGGGHRNAAIALKDVVADRFPGWRVDLVNLQELLEPVDPIHRITGYQSQNFYNGILKRGWTYGSLAMLRGLQAGIQLYSDPIEALIRKHWEASHPDLVVSLIPNFNGVLFRALRHAHSQVPYVTVMTDLADFPPHFWLEGQDQYVICGSAKAVAQASATGYGPDRIFRTSGMIIKPHFYRNDVFDRRAAREALSIEPDLPTALIMFGGYGSKTAAKIVDRLERSELDVQTIVLCGHNERLRQALEGKPRCYPIGFTDRVSDFMRMADFFIGKPGPGSLSEALHEGLPVIVESNARTMPQERYNALWVKEQKLGFAVKSFRGIADTVALILKDDVLAQYRANARRLDNRAVFEIPVILSHIMSSHSETERSIPLPPAAGFFKSRSLTRPSARAAR